MENNENKKTIKERLYEIRDKFEDGAVKVINYAQAHPVVTMAATTVISTVVSSFISYKIGERHQFQYDKRAIERLVYGDGDNVVLEMSINGEKFTYDKIEEIARNADKGNYEGFNVFRVFAAANCLDINDGQEITVSRNGMEAIITSPGYTFNPNM